MDVSFNHRGSFKKTEKFLKEMSNINPKLRQILEREAQRGVQALAAATPRDSGIAASSWGYQIVQNGRRVTVVWTNANKEGGFPVAVMLQYGYGTGSGGYVEGRDYINPAMRPIFETIANNVWKAVKEA